MRRSDLYSDDLNFIKNRYKYTIKDGNYEANNKLNYYFFYGVFINTGLDDKFELLKKKLENDHLSLDENKKKEKKKIGKINRRF